MDKKIFIQYPIGPSNSTSAEVFNNLRPSEVFISVKEISNTASVIFRDAPEMQNVTKKIRARKSVIDSLNQSIRDNAAIWSELAKH